MLLFFKSTQSNTMANGTHTAIDVYTSIQPSQNSELLPLSDNSKYLSIFKSVLKSIVNFP